MSLIQKEIADFSVQCYQNNASTLLMREYLRKNTP